MEVDFVKLYPFKSSNNVELKKPVGFPEFLTSYKHIPQYYGFWKVSIQTPTISLPPRLGTYVCEKCNSECNSGKRCRN